jgi:hypothetical protein
MDMPTTSPHKTHPDMPQTTPSPEVTPNMSEMESKGSMNMGPLLVMSEKEMAIRVGSSNTNLMSMNAMGSGTSWQPASGPMYMHYWTKGDWLLTFHYNLTAGVNSQGGPRGVTKVESANWFMPMAYHKLGKGTLQLRGMFSAEPFTFPPGGSPLLFQTGETYKGQPLIDRQHPTISLWSCQHNTLIRLVNVQPGLLTLDIRESPRSDRSPLCIDSQLRRIHQRRCLITCRIRRI